MNDQELRALIENAVARRLGDPASAARLRSRARTEHDAASASSYEQHPSHGLYIALVNVGDACLIEPSVTCVHCGYCKSHGH